MDGMSRDYQGREGRQGRARAIKDGRNSGTLRFSEGEEHTEGKPLRKPIWIAGSGASVIADDDLAGHWKDLWASFSQTAET